MGTYIITYEHNFPGADEQTKEDITHTVFVSANSFVLAQIKVEDYFKDKFSSSNGLESIHIIAMSLQKDTIIII